MERHNPGAYKTDLVQATAQYGALEDLNYHHCPVLKPVQPGIWQADLSDLLLR